MNRTELERPFEAALIKTRRGAFGKEIAYVEGTEYIRRLNDAFESAWSFEVVEHHVYDTEVVVIGKLSAGGIVKTAFGGSSITTSNSTGEVVSIADDLKAAATDALKKAASMLGVGLALYSDPPREESRRGPSRPSTSSRGNGGPGVRGVQPRGNGGNGDRLTQRQLAAIWSIGRHLEVNAEELKRRSLEAFGVEPQHLSRSDASAFITELQGLANVEQP